MNLFKKKWFTAVVCAVFLLILPKQAFAEGTYQGYIYDRLKNTPLSINGYLYQDSIDGYNMTTGPLSSPEDIFVASDDTLYVVDSGNNRVIHMDKNQNVLGTYGDQDGKGKLDTPKGVFVTKTGIVYVADTKNRRIALFSNDGHFLKEYPVPKSPLLGKDFVYSPSKLVVDKRGYMFVVSEGAFEGLMQIKPDGQFAGFFGANPVGFDISRLFIKLVATQDQKDQLAKVRPPEFSNLYQDTDGFIYTTTLGIRSNQVKRLSAVGVDTLNANGADNRYGDLYMPRQNYQPVYDAFVGITVDENGVITALDQATGKLFQYDKLGDLLFVFGGLGNQDGLFSTPVAVNHTSDGTIYVVDRTRNRIDRFHTTPFADKVHEAIKYYVDGRYDQASQPWSQVLEMNSNYDLAYYAMGKAAYKAERYEDAMKYFELAKARYDYSLSFLEYRKDYMRNHFSAIVGLIILVIVLIRLLMWFYRRSKKAAAPNKIVGKGGAAR